MTDPLTAHALVGTARAAGEPPLDDHPAAELLGALAGLSPERRLLLAGGTRAALRLAAEKPSTLARAPAVAPPEVLPACSPGAARLLNDMLNGAHDELLDEALERLARAGQRVPFATLPLLLQKVTGEPRREAARAVLGERGAWLAAQNPKWAWATGAAEAPSLEALAKAFDVGTTQERERALREGRARGAAAARGWLEATWEKEKATERASFLSTLAEGLSRDDEALLERALGDRAAGVREVARELLATLPDSAYARRAAARADAMLDLRRSVLATTLVVTPPEALDAESERDLGSVPKGMGARAYLAERAMAAVAPSRFTARFGCDAKALLAAARASEWAAPLLAGWTRASEWAKDAAWAAALFDVWRKADDKTADERTVQESLRRTLATMTPEDAEARVVAGLQGRIPLRLELGRALFALPVPWSDAVARTFLSALRARLRGTDRAAAYELLAALSFAVKALPPSAFDAALADFPDEDDAQLARAIERFQTLVRARQALAQEIPT